eukprot:5831286-Prymnesium_polylepis.1
MRAGLVAPAAAGAAGGWCLLALVAVADIQLALVVGGLETVGCGHLPRIGTVAYRVADDEDGVEVLRPAIGFEHLDRRVDGPVGLGERSAV